jgi:hypothetical protein
MTTLKEVNPVLQERYEKYVSKWLDSITQAKLNYISNDKICERINEKNETKGTDEELSVKEFAKMTVFIEDLALALQVGTSITVDKLESKLLKKAIKDGNVTALLKCLEVLAPEKWGKQKEEAIEKVMPEITLIVENASVPQEKLDEYVKDLMAKTGQIANVTDKDVVS